MAVSIAHEYAHSQQRSATCLRGVADNEMAAWDYAGNVYGHLKDEAYHEAHNGWFGPRYHMLSTMAGRVSAYQDFLRAARQHECGGADSLMLPWCRR